AANITTGTIDNARLGLIPSANIADNAITTTKLANAAVTAPKIGTNQVVKTLNGLTDGVNLSAGANVTITPSGNTLTIASSGGGVSSQWTTSGSTIFYNLGKVGIGSTSPDASLQVHHASSNTNLADIQLADLVAAYRNTNNTDGNMSLISFQDSGGWGNAQVGAIQTSQANHAADLVFFTRNAGNQNSIERLRIRSDGKIVLNTLGTAGTSQLCRNASNQIATCSSSLRYKTGVAPFTFGLNLVQRLRPITFDWIADGTKDIGFGAEDVAAIEPLLVTYNANGEVEGVKYDRISAVLVNAIKEQQRQIEAQQFQLKQQQGLIDALKMLVCKQNPSATICR
ncbi:MAG TPA: tail fiber domain-containing protein, partial [Pyrinomonadaceae bacterium]|nr:tail fiber domain-containing protein [Pyrinomonadaceae bacterium]